MQVYEGWGNYDRRFWHCPLARVSYGNDICSSTMLGSLTFFWEFSNSPTMMTIVASLNGWIPQPLTPIRITSTTSTTSSFTTCSGIWMKHLLPQIALPTTSAALV
jgi:hypothetical protein